MNKMSEDQPYRLKVIGENTLHCDGCERTVEFALSRMPGVERVKADQRVQEIAFVLTSGETDLEKVIANLRWIGYQVEER
jgi:copper chaperone CopZ